MAKRKVAFDRIAWTVPSKHTKSGWEHLQAERGEVVDLPDDHAERLDALGAVVGEHDELAEATPAPSAVTDDAIAAMTVDEVNAYIGQIPDGDDRDAAIDRVLAIENQRDKPRVGVLSLDPDFEPDADDQD